MICIASIEDIGGHYMYKIIFKQETIVELQSMGIVQIDVDEFGEQTLALQKDTFSWQAVALFVSGHLALARALNSDDVMNSPKLMMICSLAWRGYDLVDDGRPDPTTSGLPCDVWCRLPFLPAAYFKAPFPNTQHR